MPRQCRMRPMGPPRLHVRPRRSAFGILRSPFRFAAVPDLSPRACRLGLCAALLLAALAGLWRLGTPPLWLDEASSWYNVSGSWLHLWDRAVQGEDSGGLLYSALLKLWSALAGTGEATLRVPGVVLWIATIAVIARTARLVWNRRAALLAASAALAHPSLLAAARQARSYILLCFLAALVLHALAGYMTERRRHRLCLLAAASLGAAATHVMGVFVGLGAASGLLVLGGRDRAAARRAALVAAPALAFAAAWAVLLRDRAARNLASFWIPGTFFSNYLAIGVLLVVPLAVACLWLLWRDPSPRSRTAVAALAAFAAPVALGPAIVSALASKGTHLVQLRYALSLVPLGVWAAGGALATLPRRLAAAATTLAIAVSLACGVGKQLYAPVTRAGHDIRGAASFLSSTARPGDIAVIEAANNWMPLAYYGAWTAPLEGRDSIWRVITGNGGQSAQTGGTGTLETKGERTIWLVRFSRRTAAPPDLLERATLAGRFGTLSILTVAPPKS